MVGVVEQANVPITTELTARMKGSETVELRARVEGFLVETPFQEGRAVSKGQVVFRIDPRSFQARLQSAKARLAKADANLTYRLTGHKAPDPAIMPISSEGAH